MAKRLKPSSSLDVILLSDAGSFASGLLADELIASGIDAHTSCVAVPNASTPQQHIHRTTLAALDDDAVGPAPVIMLIGHAIR